METLRLWLSALTAPLIAAFGVWIGLQQYRLQKYKLRHDLSDRRWVIFSATRELIRSSVVSMSDDSLVTFDLAVVGASFLFGADITKYLATLRTSYCKLLEISDIKSDNDFANDADRAFLLEQQREERRWMRDQLDAAERVFRPYLDLSTR